MTWRGNSGNTRFQTEQEAWYAPAPPLLCEEGCGCTVNGIPGCGASILGPGPAIAGGMVFVNSGNGSHQSRRGNMLLAFGPQ